MEWLRALVEAMAAFAVCAVGPLLVHRLLVRSTHTVGLRELLRFARAGLGFADHTRWDRHRVPDPVRSPPEWLAVPARLAQAAASENRSWGRPARLDGHQLGCFYIGQATPWIIVAAFAPTLGCLLAALVDRGVAMKLTLGLVVLMLAAATWTVLQARSGLKHAGTKRMEAIRRDLTHAADLMTLVLDSGGELEQALTGYVAFGAPGPMTDDLRLMLQEMRAGSSRPEAFQRLRTRNPIDEIERLVTVVDQADRTGTPLAEVLRRQAELLRLERLQRAGAIAERMAVDSQVWLAGIAVATLIVLVGPFLMRAAPLATKMLE